MTENSQDTYNNCSYNLFEKKFVVDDQKAVLFNLAKQHKKINRLEKQRIMC